MPVDYERFNERQSASPPGFGHGARSRPSVHQLEELVRTLTNVNVLALPSVPLEFKQHLPKANAVYLCLLDETVLYVGQSVDIRSRWSGHEVCDKIALYKPSGARPNIRVAWLECPKHLLDFVEIYCIGLFQPPLNIRHRDS